MLRLDPAYRDKAARVSALARDITEYLAALELPPPGGAAGRPTVAYHAACSHAARPADQSASRRSCWPRPAIALREPREAHLCCGSAGTYNILQPDIAARLATARRPTSPPPAPTSSPPATSAA